MWVLGILVLLEFVLLVRSRYLLDVSRSAVNKLLEEVKRLERRNLILLEKAEYLSKRLKRNDKD